MNPDQVTRQEFLFLSGPEKWLFYILTFASIGYLIWRIWQRTLLWRQGKPMGELRAGLSYWIPSIKDLQTWGSNLWTYVIGQRKVRAARRRSGAPMHLLIFFGFLALFIGTTLLAINTYGPVKFHHGLYFQVYEQALDWMGLAFLVGVSWAFVRRMIQSKKNLGTADVHSENPKQKERQWIEGRRRPMTHTLNDFLVLGLLFLVGFTGFLLEAARIGANPQPFDSATSPIGFALSTLFNGLSPTGYKVIWWVHMVWIWCFFCAIPHMRLRHIVMAILTSASKPTQPIGELKPISMEEVEKTGLIGVSKIADYSRWNLMSLDACMECGRCTEVCPAWNVGKALNPKQVVQDIRGILGTEENVPATITDEALWACTTCNACVEVCPVHIRHVDLIVDARRNLIAEGQLSGTAAVMLRQTGSTNHAWGASSSNREDWMAGLDVPLARDGQDFEYLFWVGCAGATDPGAVKTTKAVASLLKKAGVSFACLGKEEACTGDPARRVGDEFLFQEKAMSNASIFAKFAVKKVVTACPHCFNTLKNEYGQFEAKMEVFHHSQLLADLVAAGKLQSANLNVSNVTFHDPCYLGRINGESDAPRALLGEKTSYNGALEPHSTTKNLHEPKHFANRTRCCGAGGGRMWMEEPIDQRPSSKRAEELLATGADTVAVACPFCRIMLDAGLKQESTKEINLVDIAELLQQANT